MKTLKNINGQIIGHIDGCVLYKRVDGSKHMLLIPKAWCYDKEVIEEAIDEGVEYLIIDDMNSGIRYACTMYNFLVHSQHIVRGEYGVQYMLPLEHWRYEDIDQIGMFDMDE